MKKLFLLVLLVCMVFVFQGCSKRKTYADMLKEEKEAVELFLSRQNINVISYSDFIAADTVTDVSKNEYVFFKDKGVYMQIEYRGEGKVAEDRDQILVRFMEVDLLTGDTISNLDNDAIEFNDEFKYSKTAYNASGTFVLNNGNYGWLYWWNYRRSSSSNVSRNTYVPGGWLIPLDYVKIGRSISERPKVRLIVPSKNDVAHYWGSYMVKPYYYELTYQLSR